MRAGRAPTSAWNDSRNALMPNDRSHIRRPTEADLRALFDLEQACFLDYYAPHRFMQVHFKTYVRNERALCFVAMRRGSLLGYVAGLVGRGRAPRARLDSLAVDPRHQGRGVGSRLLRRFLTEARRQGCGGVTLEVAIANDRALRFFDERGFCGTSRLPGYYTPRHDGLRMQATL